MMYGQVKAKKKTNNPFPTQEVRAKSFARELKALLLPNEECVNLKDQEYRKYIEALNDAMFRVDADFSYEHNGESKISPDYISKSRLSDWWHGKSIPEPSKQVDIEKAFPNLATKWFDRSHFSNRFQLHLATLDLHYIDSKDSKYADNEAATLIKKIIDDWKPKKSNRLEISGPKKRGGYNLDQHVAAKMFMPEANVDFLAECEVKSKIKYDLSLGPVSYVDSLIPEGISNMYQEGNPLSIVPYMFCLLCLGADDDSNYKHDLFLDFLSVLNCAFFLVYKQAGGMIFIPNDDIGTSILKLFFQVNEYYYDDIWSVENQKKRRAEGEIRTQKLKNKGLTLDPIPAHACNQPIFHLSDILEDIITNKIPLTPANESEIQELTIHTPRLFKDLRKFYLNLYTISGMTEEEIMDNMLKKIRDYRAEDGSDITTYSNRGVHNHSPYE